MSRIDDSPSKIDSGVIKSRFPLFKPQKYNSVSNNDLMQLKISIFVSGRPKMPEKVTLSRLSRELAFAKALAISPFASRRVQNSSWKSCLEIAKTYSTDKPPTMSALWTSARVQDDIKAALALREAGNQAFRSGDYKLSTEKYGEANYEILWLKGQRYTGAISKSDWSIVEAITEAQFTTQSNEAASWLKHDIYAGEDNLFMRALGCTSKAMEALKDQPTK